MATISKKQSTTAASKATNRSPAAARAAAPAAGFGPVRSSPATRRNAITAVGKASTAGTTRKVGKHLGHELPYGIETAGTVSQKDAKQHALAQRQWATSSATSSSESQETPSTAGYISTAVPTPDPQAVELAKKILANASPELLTLVDALSKFGVLPVVTHHKSQGSTFVSKPASMASFKEPTSKDAVAAESNSPYEGRSMENLRAELPYNVTNITHTLVSGEAIYKDTLAHYYRPEFTQIKNTFDAIRLAMALPRGGVLAQITESLSISNLVAIIAYEYRDISQQDGMVAMSDNHLNLNQTTGREEGLLRLTVVTQRAVEETPVV